MWARDKGGCSLKHMLLVGPTEVFVGLTYSLLRLWREVSFEVECSKRHSIVIIITTCLLFVEDTLYVLPVNSSRSGFNTG